MIMIFFDWLKDHDFYDAWIEGYNINNEELSHPYDSYMQFASGNAMMNWVFEGCRIMTRAEYANIFVEKYNPELYKKIEEWRSKYLEKWKQLDYEWQVYNTCSHDIY